MIDWVHCWLKCYVAHDCTCFGGKKDNLEKTQKNHCLWYKAHIIFSSTALQSSGCQHHFPTGITRNPWEKEIPEPHPKPAESPAQVDWDTTLLWRPLVQATPGWGGAGGFRLQGISQPAQALPWLKAPRCCSSKGSSFVKSPGNLSPLYRSQLY